MGLDVGAESSKLFAEAVARAKTIVWNGEWRRRRGDVDEWRWMEDTTRVSWKLSMDNVF